MFHDNSDNLYRYIRIPQNHKESGRWGKKLRKHSKTRSNMGKNLVRA